MAVSQVSGAATGLKSEQALELLMTGLDFSEVAREAELLVQRLPTALANWLGSSARGVVS